MKSWDLWFKSVGRKTTKKYKAKIEELYDKYALYPLNPLESVFLPYKLTPLDEVKVVIINDKPSPLPNQAHGLALSSLSGMTKELYNVFTAIEEQLDIKCDYNNTDLTRWAEQGVLLLNKTPVVPIYYKLDHKFSEGEEVFKNYMISLILFLIKDKKPKVFINLGTNTNMNYFLDYFLSEEENIHRIYYLYNPKYPKFFESSQDVFKGTNEFLKNIGEEEINWR